MNEGDFWKEFSLLNYDFSMSDVDVINFKLFDSRWKWLLDQTDYGLFVVIEKAWI